MFQRVVKQRPVMWVVAVVLSLAAAAVVYGQAAKQGSKQEEIGIIVVDSQAAAGHVLARLKSGWDFGVLAREVSTDATAVDGGSMGELDPSELKQSLRDALKGVGPGQYSAVTRMGQSYAILTVLPPRKHTEELPPAKLKALVNSGEVRTGFDISGDQTMTELLQGVPKPKDWGRNLQEVCSLRREVHAAAVQRTSTFLAAAEGAPGKYTPKQLIAGHGELSQLYAYVGQMNEAIVQAEDAYQIALRNYPAVVPNLEESIGALYLHKSEMENGEYRDSGTLDLWPPDAQEAKEHVAKEDDSQQAIVYFMKYLEVRPDDYQVRWLLNLAYRTLGEYPAGVPKQYLIPEGDFASKDVGEHLGRFVDVAKAAGLNVFGQAGGALVEDFENNGRLDVMTSSSDACDPMHYFHNNGDGTFSDWTKKAGLENQLGGLNMVAGDYNNDGCVDVLVLRGAWEFPTKRSLLRNNCNGTFTDVTDAAGLGGRLTMSQTAVWADINNDGYLDLFIGNENSPSQLFLNKGNGTFEDISHKAGVDRVAFTKAVTAVDYDNDGYMDLYVSNLGGKNFLYHNNHNDTFTDVAKEAGVQGPYFSFVSWFFDYNNDGWPDLFVTSYFNSVDQVVRSMMGLPVQIETMRLYRNMHNGTFKDVTKKVGLDKALMPMGSNFGDIDNDGYLDIYLGQGQPSFTGVLPHVLYRNVDGKRFVDVTAATGTGELHKGHEVAFADLERDGFEDIVAETGGAIPSDKHTTRVFRNPGNGNDWINVKLIGVKTNRTAVGAQIKVTVRDGNAPKRAIYRRVGENSSFGGNPLEQHIGLGPHAKIVALDIWWPASNTRQHFTQVKKDEFLSIKEFAKGYKKLDRPMERIGGAAKD
ncbi:MAG TPA: FG-GAP-like repeat-containing protein [Acidobacteriaceae bacterium]|nr:FG-GAP-like repeat-containing protein [Acidobacteriaceae bacterium]